jgi:hypothetical protein
MPRGNTGKSVVRKALLVAVGLSAAAVVAGCSADDVEFQGKIFELAGMNNIGKRGKAPQVAPRTGLVVPPDLSRLPDPNQPAAPNEADTALASINDPDRVNVQDQAELERRQAEACKDYELAKQRGDQEADLISGPMGPCRPSILTSVGKWVGSN